MRSQKLLFFLFIISFMFPILGKSTPQIENLWKPLFEEAQKKLTPLARAKQGEFFLLIDETRSSIAAAAKRDSLDRFEIVLESLRKTKRPFPDSSLAARARRALLNEGFPGKPYVA